MKIGFISLGCPKNRVDTENLISSLLGGGAELSDRPDTFIVNTCAFIRPAVEESIEEILNLCELKKRGVVKRIFVVGCLVERYGKRALRRLIPEVDGFFGVIERPEDVASKILGRGSKFLGRVVTTGHFAYVKIAEGCSRRCTFCVIPSIRGRHRSRDIEEIVKEVDSLEGVKEVILVSQDTTYYGRDIGKSLVELLKALKSVGSHRWLRVLYMHPSGVDERLVDTMAEDDRVVPYFDIPIQHTSDKILSLMKRGYRRRHIEKLYRTIRDRVPEAVMRTSVIVGFPGEGRKEFDELMSFIKDHPFEYLGGFKYWDEEGAYSRLLKGKVGDKVKKERLEAVYSIQYGITERLLGRFVGRELDVLFDGEFGRFYGQAPEVDGVVKACGEPGEMRKVKIKGVEGYDLTA